MAVEVGDFVQVVSREVTPADLKAGLFYNHFRNLAGVVERIYADGNLCVVVDHSTLTRDMLARLKRAERVIKPRWKPLGASAPAAPGTADTGTGGIEAADDGNEPEGEPGAVGAAPDAGSDEAAAEVEEETGDLRVNPGLKYAIVLAADDVKVTRRGTGAPGSTTGRSEAGPAIRVSEEQLKAAERQHMEKLLSRANG